MATTLDLQAAMRQHTDAEGANGTVTCGARRSKTGMLFASVLFLVACLCASPSLFSQERRADTAGNGELSSDDPYGGEFPPVVSQYNSTQKKETVLYDDADLASWGVVSTAGRDLITVISEPNPYPCVDSEIVQATLKIELRMGEEDYTFGSTSFTSQVTVQVVGQKLIGGVWTPKYTTTCNLNIDEEGPQQRCISDFTQALKSGDIERFQVQVLPATYNPPTHIDPTTQAELRNQIRLEVFYTEQIRVAATPTVPPPIPEPLVEVVGIGGDGDGWTPHTDNPVEFEWETAEGCTPDQFTGYQLQLLRLFNRKDEYGIDEEQLRETVDWGRALTIEAGSAAELKQKLTVAEGTGYYAWRVRPIGDKFPGGIANDLNWGLWSVAPNDADVIDISDIDGGIAATLNDVEMDADMRRSLFFYSEFDEDKNWIYTRNFTEGDLDKGTGVRIAEGIVYATPLLRTRQSQSHMQTQSQALISETLYDFNGRAAVQTLSAPEPWAGFNYSTGFVVGYTAAHFDDDATAMDPTAMNAGSISGGATGTLTTYYSDLGSEVNVPSAEGFPFVRTLWYPDASGRVCEQGGAGNTFRIGGTDLDPVLANRRTHTGQYFYAGAFESELLAMFGAEAPATEGVRVLYSMDENKVVTAQYVSKEGQTLATCLVKDASNLYENVDLGVIEQSYSGTSETSIDGMRASGDAVLYVGQVAITGPTSLDISFELSPEKLEMCPGFCKTCDYKLSVRIYSTKNPEAAYDDVMALYAHEIDLDDLPGMDQCNGGISPITITPGITAGLPVLPTFSDIGTFTVEVRLQGGTVDETDDLKRKHVELWSNELRDALRGSMNTGGFLDELHGYLDYSPPDIEGFYNALESTTDVAVEPVTVGEEIVEYIVRDAEEDPCWELHIPKLTCNDAPICSVDENYHILDGADNVVSFEQMLYDRWGPSGYNYTDKDGVATGRNFGTDPQKYFLHRGAKLYPELDPSGDEIGANGLGAFDLMITHMMADGYDCRDLLMAWEGLVESFGTVATEEGCGDPDRPNPSFDLMETFLKTVGKKYEGISDCPYGDCPNGLRNKLGFLEFAYKYFQYDPSNLSDEEECTSTDHEHQGDCECDETFVGKFGNWNSSDAWAADDLDEAYDDKAWENLYDCIQGTTVDQNRLNISKAWCGVCKIQDYSSLTHEEARGKANTCAEEFRDSLVDKCLNVCRKHEAGFRESLRRAHYEHGEVMEGDDLMPDGSDIPLGTHVVPLVQLESEVEQLIARCEDDCQLSMVDHDGYIVYPDAYTDLDRIGTPEEIEKLQKVFSSNYRVSILETEGECESPLEPVVQYGDVGKAIARAMNEKLRRYRIAVLREGTGTVNSNFQYIWETIYQGTLEQAGVGDACPVNWDWDDNQGGGSGAWEKGGAGILSEENPNEGDCCPTMTDPYIFAQEDWLWGEFVYNPSYHSIAYRRVCNRNGEEYIHERILCSGFCLLLTATKEEKEGNSQILSPYWSDGCERRYPLCFAWVDIEPDTTAVIAPVMCEDLLAARLRAELESQIGKVIDSRLNQLRHDYQEKCIDKVKGNLHLTKSTNLYHFTLYYYDRAGNLVRTVPPAGVRLLAPPNRDRLHFPAHTMVTQYEYNAQGELIRENTPDAGDKHFYYDKAGRIRLSQDAKQFAAAPKKFSYSRYDLLSRPIEVGQSDEPPPLVGETVDEMYWRLADLATFPTTGEERVFTEYTEPTQTTNPSDLAFLTHNGEYEDGTLQRYTLNRVAHVFTDEGVHTQYSYDPHGNVEWVRQEAPGIGTNYVRYDYDLISGKMLAMTYDEHWKDHFYHCYRYDEDNRLVEVKTSRDGEIWDSDARYHYYAHGPLKRIEYGEDRIQGLDYVYTLQGWLKAINHPAMGTGNIWNLDPGLDGVTSGTTNGESAHDAFGMMLEYYTGDFIRSNTHPYNSTAFDATPGTGATKRYHLHGKSLYNGNIATWTSNIQPAPAGPTPLAYQKLTGYQYEYDVLNRLRTANFRLYNQMGAQGNWWGTLPLPQGYHESYTYDPNGNLLTLNRKGVGADAHAGAPPAQMDNLNYTYYGGTNRLERVTDGPISIYNSDIESQAVLNYQYDPNGNLIIDKAEGITGVAGDVIEWTHYGKVKKVTKTGGDVIEFLYDAAGNRVKKTSMLEGETHYVYEAGGKVVAIYRKECDGGAPDSDGDGTEDIEDNCPDNNGNQTDSDGDGYGDACDNCPDNSNPHQRQNDSDGDGVPDECDNCPGIPNPDQSNPPPCTNCPNDQDCDGIPDATDNCPTTYNPFQGDLDGDGWGDLCDVCENTFDLTNTDTDSDGWGDNCDLCKYIPTRRIRDFDHDGVGDECDDCPYTPGPICPPPGEGNCRLVVAEWLIYGSSSDGRIAGVKPRQINRGGTRGDTINPWPVKFTRIVGEKEYELKDHLGNVRVVLADRKDGINLAGKMPYKAEMRAYNNYYAFGMLQPERHWSAGDSYRYGFNGQEMDNEVSGLGNSYTTQFRSLDVRIGRWRSIDPEKKSSPWLSPYAVNGNNPILMIDPAGNKEYKSIEKYKEANEGKDELGDGDWLTEDREEQKSRWQSANAYNLQRQNGYEEYTSIEQRASFYKWFQNEVSNIGYETKWADAASKVAHAISLIADPPFIDGLADLCNCSSPEAREFAETGNRVIFEDIFPKLRRLYNGPVLKGAEAYKWDALMLSQEQELVQPLYENSSAIGLISASAKQLITSPILGITSEMIANYYGVDIAPFPKEGLITDPRQRWMYGMSQMGYGTLLPSQMPSPDAIYAQGRFRDAIYIYPR